MTTLTTHLVGRFAAVTRAGLAAILLAGIFQTANVSAGFAAPGQGLQVLAQETVANGALFWETRATWTNVATPPKPYFVETAFVLPSCDTIVLGRLVMTLWGGTANYTCRLAVQINGQDLPTTPPLVFGGSNDTNAVFSLASPCVYGSGSGVWLVALPVPADFLSKNGSTNHIQISVDTPDSFDGRISQVTLLAVCQSATLNNSFTCVLAEGSGDIYRAPTVSQVDTRTLPLGEVEPTEAVTARLHALYTYGDKGQNDHLLFNGIQYGGDDVADYDKTLTGLDYGPNTVHFEVLGHLAKTNTVEFSVSAAEVPGTRETSLRPQLLAFEVTRPAPTASAVLNIDLNPVITWPVSADTYQLEYRSDVNTGAWTVVTNIPVIVNGFNTVILPRTSPQQYYQLRKIN